MCGAFDLEVATRWNLARWLIEIVAMERRECDRFTALYFFFHFSMTKLEIETLVLMNHIKPHAFNDLILSNTSTEERKIAKQRNVMNVACADH